MHGWALVTILLLGLTTAGNAAQELDVVSVRASEGRASPPRVEFRLGSMALANVRLQDLVGFAFGMLEQQIEGWPDRDLPERRFTLTATYSGANAPPTGVQGRLVRDSGREG